MSQEALLPDVFERKRFAEVVVGLIKIVNSPYCIGIDAKWGNGKTTFVRHFLSDTAKQSGIPIVIFDCFEHERSGDPLFSITQHILTTLTSSSVASTAKETTVKAAKKFAEVTGKVLVDIACQALFKQKLDDLLVTFIGEKSADIAANSTTQQLESYLTKRLQNGLAEIEIRTQFKDAVKTLAESLSESGKIIVVIDELDRCRPTFALDVLEAIKHILHAEGLVFVLSYHREQLCNTIEHEFGAGIDGNLYLHKFVNIDLTLPEGQVKIGKSKFTALAGQYINKHFAYQGKYSGDEIERFIQYLANFHGFFDLEVRTIERCIAMFFIAEIGDSLLYGVRTTLIVWSVKHPAIMNKLMNSQPITDDERSQLRIIELTAADFLSTKGSSNQESSAEFIRGAFSEAFGPNNHKTKLIRRALKQLLSFA